MLIEQLIVRGIAKPYAARVKDGSNTITTAVSQKIFIQKVIAALVGIALDFTAPSLLSGISSNGNCYGYVYTFRGAPISHLMESV